MFLQLLLLCFAVLSLGSNETFERTDIVGLYIRRSANDSVLLNSFRNESIGNPFRKGPFKRKSKKNISIYDSARVKTLQNDKPRPNVVIASHPGFLRKREDLSPVQHPGYLRKEREAFGPMNSDNPVNNNPANQFCTTRILHYLYLLFHLFHL